MKHMTSDLEGALLDAAVSRALPDLDPRTWAGHLFRPSTDWQHGGPIVERERISIEPGENSEWEARINDNSNDDVWFGEGPTPLIAAMRAYVASKLGDTVDL